MRICYISNRYDATDYINPGLLGWVDELAKRIDKVYVLTLEKPVTKPTRPNIIIVGHSRGHNRLHTIGRFYHNVYKIIHDVDAFFVWQGGHYAGLLKPFSLLYGKPVFQWKAHQHVPFYQNFYTTYFNEATFTSVDGAYPGGGRVIPIGSGIDIEHFQKRTQPKLYDLLLIGRISEAKGIHTVLAALNAYKQIYGKSIRLTVVGPLLSIKKDHEYVKHLWELCKLWDVELEIKPPVHRDLVPMYLARAKVFINTPMHSGLDRACLEAMACEIPIISTHACTLDILPTNLRQQVAAVRNNISSIATTVHTLLSKTQKERDVLGTFLRQVIVNDHNVYTLWDKILPIIKAGLRRTK